MSNKYEYGGRIGDETFNVGNLRKGNTSGDSLRTMLGSNKIRISTQQPKWALNNGPIRKQRNLGLQAKYAKLGGRLYQGGGSAKVNNIAKKQLPEFEPQHDDRYYDMYGPEAHNPKYPYTPQYGESYREGQELKIDGKNRTIVKNGDQLGYVDDKGLFHRLNISQTWKDTPQGGNYTGRYEWDDEKPKQTKPTQKVPVKKPPVKKPEPRPAPQPIQKLPQKPGSISIGNPKDDGKPGQVPTLKIEKEAPFDGYQEDKTFWDKFKKYFPGFGGGRGGGSGAGGRWKNGGSIRKYQVAGTTNSNNLNNMLKTRGNAAFNPLTNKPYTTTFDLNPQISYGNPKGWGQVYGNADIQRTPVFDQKRFGVGYNKKNLGSADMYYQNTNDDKSFGANANFNRGGYYAVGNAQIGKSSKDIGFQGGYKDDIFDVGANYNYTKGATVPGIHQLGVSAGIGDRLDISGNVTKSKIPGFNFTDIQGKYTGPKGGYVQGGFHQGDNGRGGQVIGGFKNDKGSIEGNIDYGNNINNAAVRGNYNNTVPVGNKDNKLSIGVKGSVNVNRKAGGRLYQVAGKTQLNAMPVDTGYTAPAIPNTNYYAPANSTYVNKNDTNRLKLAQEKERKRKEEYNKQLYQQGKIEPKYYSVADARQSYIDGGVAALKTASIPDAVMGETANYILNKDKFDYKNLYSDHPEFIGDALHIQNPYVKFGVNAVLSPLGGKFKVIKGMEGLSNAEKALVLSKSFGKRVEHSLLKPSVVETPVNTYHFSHIKDDNNTKNKPHKTGGIIKRKRY